MSYTLTRFTTPNGGTVNTLGTDQYQAAQYGKVLQNLDTYATRNNGTNAATSAMTLDMSLASDTGGLKLPSKAGAAPTADSFLAFNTTTHLPVFGTNGSTDTVVGAAATQTLTNKTLTSPAISSPAISSNTTMNGSLTVGSASAPNTTLQVDNGSIYSSLTNGNVALALNNGGVHFGQIWADSGATSIMRLGFGGNRQGVPGPELLTLTDGGGLQVYRPTNADMGAGTINVSGGLFQNGQQAIVAQNSADNGKKFQRVASGSLTTSTAIGNIFDASTGSLSWPATFGSTPVVQAAGVQSAGSIVWAGVTTISTTAVTGMLLGPVNTHTGTVELWGLG